MLLTVTHNLQQFFDFFLHIDLYMMVLLNKYGSGCYIISSMIILCETGFIITPFLPGDSLLFTLGAIAAQPEHPLNIVILLILLILASILGNQINYIFGLTIGPKIMSHTNNRFINKNYLLKTHKFCDLHGGKAIIFARFLPIIRTFAPFIAGISNMRCTQFTIYNIISAILWIGSLLGIGYFLGSSPIIKSHFTLVIYGIVILSIIPSSLTLIFSQKKNARN